MKKKKYWVLVGVLAMCLVAICVASPLTYKQRALQGIKGVGVVVVLSDDAVKAGLLKSQVQTDVELKLRRDGIKVLSQAEYGPILHINVFAMAMQSVDKQNTLGYVCFVNSALFEVVQILRSGKSIEASTWRTIGIVYGPQDKFSSYVRRHISDSLDMFLNDYLAANPKEQPTKGEVKNRDIFDQVEESTKP